MRCARRMCRGESVGGQHGHAGRVTLPDGSAGRLAPPDGGGTPSTRRTLRNAVVVRGWLKRRQDGGFPCGRAAIYCGRRRKGRRWGNGGCAGARPSRGGSAGRLAPPGKRHSCRFRRWLSQCEKRQECRFPERTIRDACCIGFETFLIQNLDKN